MKSNVPILTEVLKEDLDMAVIGLQEVYKRIENARRVAAEQGRAGDAITILGDYSMEIRDMLDGDAGEVGLAELRDSLRKEIEETQS